MVLDEWYNVVNNNNGHTPIDSDSGDNVVVAVEDLDISYKIGRKWHSAVKQFSATVAGGQIHGIVGESGSGKSTVVKGVMRYLGDNGRIDGGQIQLLGDDIAGWSKKQMRQLWSRHMNMVPQNPYTAMNPSIRIGEQIAEVLRITGRVPSNEIKQTVYEMLRRVRLADPKKTARRYPHELSGGQQQRVVLAMAFSSEPRLLLLDEPTTSLDVTTEAAILDLVHDLIYDMNTAAFYVTHNLGVVAQVCDDVTVMYAGEIMESASVATLYDRPLHPYTIGLLNCVPTFGQSKRNEALRTIPGRPPTITNRPNGCVFADRCPVALDHCFTEHPPLETTPDNRHVRCHRWEEIYDGELIVDQAYESGLGEVSAIDTEVLLSVDDLAKHFEIQRGVLKLLRGEDPETVKAVDGVNLSIQKARTLGLVGESGSGKTTLSRMIIGLLDKTRGKIEMLGTEIEGTARQRPKELLSQMQMVFQNPQESLNPYLTVGQALRRPLIKLRGMTTKAANERIVQLLNAVNLDASYALRYPGELSGGEKQRIAIARAFASDPNLIVCDEPVSALDVSVQAAVLNLLARLQDERETAYLFISHDLAVVTYIADYVAVMYLGYLFEVGYAQDFNQLPYHPYTEALISAIPVTDPDDDTDHIRLSDNVPSSRNLPSGCRFHTRCPRKIGDICENENPPWRQVNEGNWYRCHIEVDELIRLQEEEPVIANTGSQGEPVEAVEE
jgi:peptide/nickel transport system ATP-binding protein